MEEVIRKSKADADLSPEFLELRESINALIARVELLMETSIWGRPASSKHDSKHDLITLVWGRPDWRDDASWFNTPITRQAASTKRCDIKDIDVSKLITFW
jgi:hypothetical protein